MRAGRAENGELPTTLLHCLADGSCRTIDELKEALPLNRPQISDGAFRLIMRGYAERVERGCYQLTPEGIAAAERGEVLKGGPTGAHTAKVKKVEKDTLRQRAWAAMRISGTFTVADIVMSAATSTEKDADAGVRKYLNYLKAAGYIAELPIRQRGTKPQSSGFKRYRLVRNTGFKAPIYQPSKRLLHDLNTGEVIRCGK